MNVYYMIWVALILHFATAECLIHTLKRQSCTKIQGCFPKLQKHTFMIHNDIHTHAYTPPIL